MKLKEINFGSADGQNESKEPNFSEMFYENGGYYNDLLESKRFIIIGRKGSGKTTLASYFSVKAFKDSEKISLTLSMDDFIQKKLLNFAQNPINKEENSLFWRYVFLLDLGKMLNDFYSSLPFYSLKKIINRKKVSQLNNLLYSEQLKIDSATSTSSFESANSASVILSNKPQISGGLSTKNLEIDAVQKVKAKYYEPSVIDNLEKIVFDLLKSSEKNVTIFYDDMDQFEENVDFKYFLDLMKNMIYSANRLNHKLSKHCNSKVCLVMRKDIIDLLQEEANNLNKLTTDFGINITWFDNGYKNDFDHPIMQMVLHKIKNSGVYYKNKKLNEIYEEMFEDSSDKTIFEFLMERGFGRPRDIVCYLNFYKDSFPESTKITIDELKKVEQKYSEWFYQELMNEIKISDKKPEIKETMALLKRSCRPVFKESQLKAFIPETDTYDLEHKLLDVLSIMRDYSILGIKNRKNFDFIYRTGLRTKVDQYTKFVVHRGLRKYLDLP